MSAWTVSKAHIDVLVNALVNEGVIALGSAQYSGGQLWSENYRSVNIRYGERTPRPPYRFTRVDWPLDDAVVLRCIGCYDYQCMEYDGYDRQPGMRKLHKLKRALIVKHGIKPTVDDYGSVADGTWHWCEAHSGPDRLPWGIRHLTEARIIEEVR